MTSGMLLFMTAVAHQSGTFTIDGKTVHRLGFGAMRLTGPGIWGEPADRDECVRVVRRAVELMRTDFEPTSWRAFWETSVQARPAADVASELRLSLAAVYKAASRVRQRLRQELDGLLD